MCPLALFHLFGAGTLTLAIILLLLNSRFVLAPVAFFLLICFVGLFRLRLRFFLPVLSRGKKSRPVVAITFDDGPNPETTPFLLKLLFKHSVKAAFFLVGEKAEKYPTLVREILAQGHEIGNHTYSHDIFLMLRRATTREREISQCQHVLNKFCIHPLAFRPPVGVTGPGLFAQLLRSGLYCAGYSRRPSDYGNRRLSGLSRRVLRKIRAGDVLLLHDSAPHPAFKVERWRNEVEAVILGLAEMRLKPVLLSEVLQRPVMEPIQAPSPKGPDSVRIFYDTLADHYDDEQNRFLSSLLRRAEEQRFAERIAQWLQPFHSVLEIGAGTGRFTIPLSKRCRKVVAVDLSRRMLRILENKTRSLNIDNIETFSGRISELKTTNRFDMICSFSCFEYIPNLEKLFLDIRPLLKKDGILYFITAHPSFLRFPVQIGNALRQGIWLHARSQRKMARTLKKTEWNLLFASPFGLKSIFTGGMLIEVVAKSMISPRYLEEMQG